MTDVEDAIQRISNRWFLTEPLFFATLMTHRICASKEIRQIRCGEGRIEYSPEYFQTLSMAEIEEHLKAEVIRILLAHPYRQPQDLNKGVSYIASNITLNEYYQFSNLPYRADEIWKDKPDFRDQNFEFYYREYLKTAETQPSSQTNDSTGGNAGDGTDSDGTDDDRGSNAGYGTDSDANDDKGSNAGDNTDSGTDDDKDNNAGDGTGSDSTGSDGTGSDGTGSDASSNAGDGTGSDGTGDKADAAANENAALWCTDEFVEQQIKETIEHAMQSNSWGTVPKNLMEELIASLKPKVDYRKILSGFRASVLSSAMKLTRFRPSRRFGFLFMGKKRDFTTNLLIAIDVSGSVSSKDLRVFYSIINRFFKYGIESIDVLMFDTEVKQPVMTMQKAKKKIQIQGRGGTNFQSVIDYFEDRHNKDYDGLIIFTDGEALIPKMTVHAMRKTLWICNNKRNYNAHESWMAKCGRCCWIEEDIKQSK